jgi:hypothetical protein
LRGWVTANSISQSTKVEGVGQVVYGIIPNNGDLLKITDIVNKTYHNEVNTLSGLLPASEIAKDHTIIKFIHTEAGYDVNHDGSYNHDDIVLLLNQIKSLI